MSSYGFVKIIKSTQPNQTKYLTLINPPPTLYFWLRIQDPNQGVILRGAGLDECFITIFS